jgi:hypothetical protein
MMHDLPAINFFCIGDALLGVVGTCVAAQAYREAFAIRLLERRAYVFGSMLFLMIVNVVIAGVACWLALLDLRIGGARG